MKAPNTPQHEATRLNALRSLNILDTPAEERFDRLTRLVKRMFDVPIALISLVDENRQWFKSSVGLNINETSREISFCGHTILGNEVLIIEDTTQDVRFADNPLVLREPCIRFYAGCPLRFTDGSRLGTLCIIDTSPRTLDEGEIKALMDLAGLAEHELVAIELAVVDNLTRLANRRGFISIAQKCLDICARQKNPAALITFNINNLKSISENFGQFDRDRALMTFADQMRNTFRESDVFAHLDDSEFVVLVSNTSSSVVEEIIFRFRQSLEQYNKKTNRGHMISFDDEVVIIKHKHEQSIEMLLNRKNKLLH